MELDAASNNKVEDIHRLKEQVNIQPQSGQYKVFIIDEVHMLSTTAFNAFLKTLEEPPPYAIFILATTEKHKILPTILSRCQIYDFKRIDTRDIVTQLKQIGEAENIETDEEALYIIAQKADGALRDALSMFDRLSNQAAGGISYQGVIDSLGLVDYETYFQITDSILSEDAAGILMMMNRLVGQGYEAEEVVKGLASHLRDLLFFKHEKLIPLVSLPERLMDRYRAQATLCSESLLVNGLDMITDALYRAQLSPDKMMLFEVTLSKLAYLRRLIHNVNSSAEVLETKKKTNDLNNSLASEPVESGPVSKSTASTTPLKLSQLDKLEEKPVVAEIKVSESVELVVKLDATPTTSQPKPSAAPQAKTNGSIKQATIFSSLQQIASEVDEELKHDKKTTPFNADELAKVWDVFTARIDSEYVMQMLKTTVVQIIDDGIQIDVNHKRVEAALVREFNCILYLREAFLKPEMAVNVIVNEALEEVTEKRLITKKEKFEFLVEQNPSILEMTRRFKLKFD